MDRGLIEETEAAAIEKYHGIELAAPKNWRAMTVLAEEWTKDMRPEELQEWNEKSAFLDDWRRWRAGCGWGKTEGE